MSYSQSAAANSIQSEDTTSAESETPTRQVRETVELTEGLVFLPGVAEQPLTDWAQAVTCPGGRDDDAIVHLTAHSGAHLGYLTLGWFRRNTTLSLMEIAASAVREEEE